MGPTLPTLLKSSDQLILRHRSSPTLSHPEKAPVFQIFQEHRLETSVFLHSTYLKDLLEGLSTTDLKFVSCDYEGQQPQ